METLKIDFNEKAERGHLYGILRGLRGLYRIEICRWAERRSDRQNRFYHPAFVKPFMEAMAEQGQPITKAEAHGYLKKRFLSREVIDEKTGEVREFVGSTKTLSTIEFNAYLDKCAAFLNDTFGIPIPDPEVYHEKVRESNRKRRKEAA